MIDANTAALYDHLEREERNRRADAAVRLEARRRLAQEYRDQFTFECDWFQDALFRNPQPESFAKAIEDDDFCEAGMLMSKIYDIAQSAFIKHHIEARIERLRN